MNMLTPWRIKLFIPSNMGGHRGLTVINFRVRVKNYSQRRGYSIGFTHYFWLLLIKTRERAHWALKWLNRAIQGQVRIQQYKICWGRNMRRRRRRRRRWGAVGGVVFHFVRFIEYVSFEPLKRMGRGIVIYSGISYILFLVGWFLE